MSSICVRRSYRIVYKMTFYLYSKKNIYIIKLLRENPGNINDIAFIWQNQGFFLFLQPWLIFLNEHMLFLSYIASIVCP